MTMSEDMHDDGLVHSHSWAREALPEGITRLVAPRADRAAVSQTAQAMNAHPECDAGLVHEHRWARS
jgi:hypothetical protein